MQPNTIRTFIAIELNDQARAELAKLQDKLKQSDADVKWVQPQNMHLTLKFLGNVEKDKIEKIKIALDTITGQMKAFSISLSEIGAFANLNSPRVVWVGIKEGAEELKKIADKLENQSFSAHLTLGRMRSPKGKERLKEMIETLNKALITGNWSLVTINHIALFQSQLTAKGPIYTNLYEAKLKPI